MLIRMLILTVGLWSMQGLGDAPPGTSSPPTAQSDTKSATPPEGFFLLSSNVADLLIVRVADEFSHEYELDKAQADKVREAMVKRWGGFLRENREAIQPVVNEMFEIRFDIKPPAKERVQAWAGRALPLLDKMREQVEQGRGDLREVLTPEQRVRLDQQALELGFGLKLARQRLHQLKEGAFEAEHLRELWEPPAAQRAQRREKRRRQREEAANQREQTERQQTAEADQITLELKAWETYVENFMQTYRLDEGQRGAAISCLSELKQRAIEHRDRHRDEITAMEHRIKNFSGSDEALEQLKRDLTKLYGPIDEMFQELKRRIEPIPTAVQRTAIDVNAYSEPLIPSTLSEETPADPPDDE